MNLNKIIFILKNRRKRLKKALNIILLAILLVLAYNNFCYAGSIGDSPDSWIFLVGFIIVGILIIFLCLIPFFVMKEPVSKHEKTDDEIIEEITSKANTYSISELIIYVFLIAFIIFLIFFIRNNVITLATLFITSLISMAVFFHILITAKKQEKLEQESKNNTINTKKIEKNITKIRNIIYICLTIVSGLELFSGIVGSKLLALFLIISLVIKVLKNKKLSTCICFIALIISLSIIISYQTNIKFNEQFNKYITNYRTWNIP